MRPPFITNYFLANNCELMLDEKQDKIKIHENVLMTTDGEELFKDTRLGLKVLNPTNDIQMVYNYLGTSSFMADKEWRHDSEKSGRFVDMLNMGYLPILMTPSFVTDFDTCIWDEMAEVLKYENVRTPAYRHDGSRLDMEVDDIFVSKIKLKELLNIPVRDMTSQVVLSLLLNKFSAVLGV